MKILVTGANGYIGTGIVKKLLDDGHEVIATDIQTECVDMRAKRKEADIFSVDDPYCYFESPDVLLHLAWRDGFKHDSLAHIDDLAKHYRFINLLVEAGIGRVCIMGSMHEVGFWEGCINEDTPTNPLSLYGISKNALRNAVQLLTQEKNTPFQWIRGFYIVGNSQRGCSIFSKLIQANNEGKQKFAFTTGTNQYDFIDYNEFCTQVTAVVEQDRVCGIINCCSGIPMRLGERVEQFIKENRLDIRLEYGKFPDRIYDSKAVWGNNQKIVEIMENRETKLG